MACPNPHCQATLPPGAKACPACRLPLPGVLHLGRYLIAGILFRGQYLFHYQATDQSSDETVEVRVLVSPEPKARGFFLTEARTLMGLTVEGIQSVREVHAEGLVTVVLDALGDRSSRDLLPYAEKDLLRLAFQSARTLHAVHTGGLLHRDVRPDHLRLDLKRRLTIAGWGWERLIASRLGSYGAKDPAAQDYLAPELATREAGPRSDLYGLGMTLVHLATGIEPAKLYQTATQTYAWREHTHVSEPFANLIDALIQAQPGRRLNSAKTLERRLEDLLPPDLKELAASPPPAPEQTLPPWLESARRSMGEWVPDRRLAWLLALLVFLFPMLPAEGPGVPKRTKWTFTTVGDRQQPRRSPAEAVTGMSAPTAPREWRLARLYARALLHRPATVSLVPLQAAEATAAPTTWTPPDPPEPVAWEIRVSKAHHVMEVYRDSLRIMAFPVGLGSNGSTPVGSFEIVQKVAGPAYRRPDGSILPAADPRNPLGTRWLGLAVPGRSGIGIHGTPYADSIGDDLSLGCIRMRTPDVEKLFEAIPARVWVTIEP